MKLQGSDLKVCVRGKDGVVSKHIAGVGKVFKPLFRVLEDAAV